MRVCYILHVLIDSGLSLSLSRSSLFSATRAGASGPMIQRFGSAVPCHHLASILLEQILCQLIGTLPHLQGYMQVQLREWKSHSSSASCFWPWQLKITESSTVLLSISWCMPKPCNSGNNDHPSFGSGP